MADRRDRHMFLPSFGQLNARQMYTTLHNYGVHYTTLHCTALHCATLHYTTPHNTLRYTLQMVGGNQECFISDNYTCMHRSIFTMSMSIYYVYI